MTALSKRKTRLLFETDSIIRNREIVVEPEPLFCNVRLKGTRQRYAIAWSTIYMHAAQIAAERLRAERKAARAAKRAKG